MTLYFSSRQDLVTFSLLSSSSKAVMYPKGASPFESTYFSQDSLSPQQLYFQNTFSRQDSYNFCQVSSRLWIRTRLLVIKTQITARSCLGSASLRLENNVSASKCSRCILFITKIITNYIEVPPQTACKFPLAAGKAVVVRLIWIYRQQVVEDQPDLKRRTATCPMQKQMKCLVSWVTQDPKFLPTTQCQVGLYFLSNSFLMQAAMSFSILNFSKATLAQSMASCCISSFMSACFITALRSADDIRSNQFEQSTRYIAHLNCSAPKYADKTAAHPTWHVEDIWK